MDKSMKPVPGAMSVATDAYAARQMMNPDMPNTDRYTYSSKKDEWSQKAELLDAKDSLKNYAQDSLDIKIPGSCECEQ
jgi:hypothetical protein